MEVFLFAAVSDIVWSNGARGPLPVASFFRAYMLSQPRLWWWTKLRSYDGCHYQCNTGHCESLQRADATKDKCVMLRRRGIRMYHSLHQVYAGRPAWRLQRIQYPSTYFLASDVAFSTSSPPHLMCTSCTFGLCCCSNYLC